MPITVRTADEGLGFIMEGEGAVTGQEILAGVFERFASEDRTRRYIYGISDYTAATSLQMTSEEVKAVADKDKLIAAINPGLVVAIAAPQEIIYGLSRMFQVYADDTGWDISVHKSLEATRKTVLAKLQQKGFQVDRIKFR